jgi:hypothetical protein
VKLQPDHRLIYYADWRRLERSSAPATCSAAHVDIAAQVKKAA